MHRLHTYICTKLMQKNRHVNPEEYNVGVCVNCRISVVVVSSRVTHFHSPPHLDLKQVTPPDVWEDG